MIFDKFRCNTVLTFHSVGINWIWYLKIRSTWKYGSPTCEILRHYRVHKGDEDHPESVGTFRIIENNTRQACAVEFIMTGDHLTVAAVDNIRYVFDYH